MKKLLLSSLATITLSTAAFSSSNIGCGLGYVALGGDSKSLVGQLFQMTTNHATSSQAFGITSGTSGCSQPSNIFVSNETHIFVNENMDKLALNISAGQGETLDTLATLLKIEDKATFNAKLQTNFDKIYTSENVTSSEVIDNIIKIAG